MEDKVSKIIKKASKTERFLNKLLEENLKEVKRVNNEKGLKDDGNPFVDWHKYETDALYGNEVKVERDGVCVWLFDLWVSSNVHPKGVEIRDNCHSVKCASMWYTPFHYMTNITVDELYEKSETEKVLYKDADVKVSMVRRNVIPNFKSCQWCHKLSHHEYVWYLKYKRRDCAIETEISLIKDKLNKAREGEISITDEEKYDLLGKIRELHNKLDYWHECLHAESLTKLKSLAKRYFNDWY